MRAAALILCCLSAADGWGQAPKEADARGVRDVALGIISADNARDLARVLEFYADDAVLLPPNEAPVQGKAAIKPRYETLFTNFVPEIVGEIAELQVTSGWGFVRGYNRGRLTPRAGGEARLLNDVYVMILKRMNDGTWKIAHLMWHSASEAQRK